MRRGLRLLLMALVCALLGGGGYAEYANVKYDMLMPVPATCSFEEAAAIPEAFATALKMAAAGKLTAVFLGVTP